MLLLFPFLKERVYNTKMFVCMDVCLSKRKRPSVRFSMILMKLPYRFFGSGNPNPVSDFRSSVAYLGGQVSQKSKFGLVWGKGPRIGFRGRGVTIRGAFRSRTSRSVCYPSEFSYEYNGRLKDNVLWRWDISVKQNCIVSYVSTKIDFRILQFWRQIRIPRPRKPMVELFQRSLGCAFYSLFWKKGSTAQKWLFVCMSVCLYVWPTNQKIVCFRWSKMDFDDRKNVRQ